MEDVVDALVARALDGVDVGGLLDHADEAQIAGGARAIGAGIDVRDVVADGAEAEAGLEVAHGFGEGGSIFVGGAENVEGEALRGLGTDAGQLLQLFNEPGHWLGVACHDLPPEGRVWVRGIPP